MSLTRTPKEASFPQRAVDELHPNFDRFSPLPTAATVKARQLFGIPLTSAFTHETISDETIHFYIDSAISELEHTLNICINPVEFREKHDYNQHDFSWTFNYLKLDHAPIIHVTKLELSFSNNFHTPGFIEFPLEYVFVMNNEGTVQLVPAFGTATSGFVISTFSGTQYHALRAMGITNFPGAIRIEYTAGFEKHKVPFILVQLIEILAAIQILSIMGPILFPQNSVSIGIDGVSQSTSTAGVNFFQARLKQLTEERDRLLDVVRSYYQTKFLVDYF